MDNDLLKPLRKLVLMVFLLGALVVALMGGLLFMQFHPEIFIVGKDENDAIPNALVSEDIVRDGIHVATGLVAEKGYKTVISNCTNCHSADLIIQNRGTRERWVELIKWMQQTQGLWELGDNEEIIVSYLSEFYAPVQSGRRANLSGIEWYELSE